MKSPTAFMIAIFTFAVSAGRAEEVHVYNWSDYIDEALLEKFEAETGIDVIYDVFELNEMLEAKLLAGHSGYDVVVPSDGFVRRQISGGLVPQARPDEASQCRAPVGPDQAVHGSIRSG